MYFLFIPCLFIFLFSLYSLSYDDFVFLRKNITLEQIFNITFLALVVSFLGSRFLYAVSYGASHFINPLVFLLFPYYPGFSIIGAVYSFLLFIMVYTIRLKISTARLIDFVSCSMVITLACGFLFFAVFELISKKHIAVTMSFLPVFFIFLSFGFFTYLLPKLRSGELQEGSIGLLFLLSFSLISIIGELFIKTNKVLRFLSVEGVIAGMVLISSLILFIRQEKIITKLLKLKNP